MSDYPEKCRYQKKISILFSDSEKPIDPYVIPIDQWVNDPSKWPHVEFGQIYTYLIESPGIFTREKLKACKSLDAYNYYIRYIIIFGDY